MQIFVPITKVDAQKRLVYGTVAAETPDKAGEIFDYTSSKANFERWSQEIAKASDGRSRGNVRAMHSAVAVGKLTDIAFDDTARRIEAVAKVVDDDAWRKVEEGVYTGFSIGGRYAKRWPDQADPAFMRYTAEPSEVSLVDNPAIPGATFTLVKYDGQSERRPFAQNDAENDWNSGPSDNGNDAPEDSGDSDVSGSAGPKYEDASAADAAQAMHDYALTLGAHCPTAAKLHAHRGDQALAKYLAWANDTLAKQARAIDRLTKALSTQERRLAALEAQPMPAKGILKTAAFAAVEKSADAMSRLGQGASSDVADPLSLVKAAQANPLVIR